MAKRQSKDTVAEASKSGIDALMTHVMKGAPGLVCSAKDLADRVWGLPSDYISYRWLTDQTVHTMGKIIGVAGAKESCKSAYAMSLAKIWLDAGGIAIYIDTENKKSPVLYKSIVGEENLGQTIEFLADSTEQWQEQILTTCQFLEENESYKNKPIIFVIDSLGGVDTLETEERISKEGHVNARNTGGMVKAKSHNEFFRHINKYLIGKPYNLVYVNHLSDDPMSPIQGAKRKPGGTGQDYHALMDFWFSVVKSKAEYKASKNYSEKLLKIKNNKNSHGISNRALEIPYRMQTNEETGQLDKVWFDWDAATAMLLTDDKNAEIRQRTDGIIKVTVSSNRYSCQALGLVGVSDSELGAAIRNNIELRERLSDALGINRVKLFESCNVPDRDVYEKPVSVRIKASTPPSQGDVPVNDERPNTDGPSDGSGAA